MEKMDTLQEQDHSPSLSMFSWPVNRNAFGSALLKGRGKKRRKIYLLLKHLS